jgi:lambda family phage portal protein
MARARLELIKRSFPAGPSDRTSGWRAKAQETINQKAKRDLAITRSQARELYRHNPYARGVVNSIVANLIGCGIRPQSRVMKPRLYEPLTDFNDRVDEAWKRWAEAENYYTKQRMVQQEKLVSGEILVRKVTVDDGREIPLSLELIRSERLATNDNFRRRAPNVVQGIEFGADGRPAAYWVYPENASDQALVEANPVRYPADQILHIFDPLEPGQIRGMTRFLTCAGTFEAIAQYLDFVLTKERVASAFALMITRQQGLQFPSPDGNAPQTDEQGNTLDYVEGGMIFHGDPGEDIKGVNSSVQPAQVDKLMQILLRQCGRGMDAAYELISRDLSQVTYLSARQGENQDRRHWQPQQEDLNRQLNCPIWTEFIRMGSLMGMWRVPYGRLDMCAADWITDGWDWIDPSKDVAGEIEAIKAGLMTPQEAAAKHGRDWFQVLTDIEAFKKEATAKKLTLEIFPDMVAKAEAKAQPKPEPKAVEAPEEQPDEETTQEEVA